MPTACVYNYPGSILMDILHNSKVPGMTKAFTLLEITVSLGIVVVVMVLLVSTIWQSRQRALNASCISSERQITSALALYLQDYDGYYPVIDTGSANFRDRKVWTQALSPYVSRRIICPLVARPGALAQLWADPFATGYAMNENLNNFHFLSYGAHYRGQSDAVLVSSATTVVIADSRACVISINMPDINSEYLEGTYCKRYASEVFREVEGGKRHQGGANYSFGDGHAKWFPPLQLRTGVNGDGIHPGFGL